MDNTGVKQQIRVRCETCRGKGSKPCPCQKGCTARCVTCNGFGFYWEVFCLKPKPKSLREQLEASDPRDSPCATFDPSFGFKEQNNG